MSNVRQTYKKPPGAPRGTVQPPLFVPPCDWTPPDMATLPSWAGARRVAFDVETRDPTLEELGPGIGRENSYMVGFSIAIQNGPAFYLPIRHGGGDNVDVDQALGYLRTQAAAYTGEVVGTNIGYDLRWALDDDVEFNPDATMRDIQIAEALLYELHFSYSLENIAQRRGLPGKDEKLLREAAAAYGVDPKGGLHALPGRFAGAYGTADSVRPLEIIQLQEAELAASDANGNNLWDIYQLESAVTPVLARMSHRGVRVDQERLAKVREWSIQEEAEQLRTIHHLTTRKLSSSDLLDADALAPILREIGIEVGVTPKTGKPQIDKHLLEGEDNPVTDAIRRGRQMIKLRNDFCNSVERHLIRGRIHCTFNQLPRDDDEEGGGGIKGAKYGRLSCEHVNMQQQPSKDDFAAMWRSIYLPEEGADWASEDYSQQEPRLTVHYGELLEADGAKEAGDRYRTDPATDYHQMMADMTGLPRKHAKCVFLGLCYGMGGAKLARDLGLPTAWRVTWKQGGFHSLIVATEDEAEALAADHNGRCWETAGEQAQGIMDQFNERVPFPRILAVLCEQHARKKGYTRTILGRHCHYPRANGKDWAPNVGGYDWCHKALNRLIQGGSADQTKRALVDVDRAGHFLQLQVHDELGLSVHSREEAEAVADIMRNGVVLSVPSRVDVEVGPSWGEAK